MRWSRPALSLNSTALSKLSLALAARPLSLSSPPSPHCWSTFPLLGFWLSHWYESPLQEPAFKREDSTREVGAPGHCQCGIRPDAPLMRPHWLPPNYSVVSATFAAQFKAIDLRSVSPERIWPLLSATRYIPPACYLRDPHRPPQPTFFLPAAPTPASAPIVTSHLPFCRGCKWATPASVHRSIR